MPTFDNDKDDVTPEIPVGTLELDGRGTPITADTDIAEGAKVVFTPADDFQGTVKLAFEATDNAPTPLTSDPATVTIAVGAPPWFPPIDWDGDEDGYYRVMISNARELSATRMAR